MGTGSNEKMQFLTTWGTRELKNLEKRLILINFASFLVNAAQYILIIGSYLYTSYSNWSLRRLRRCVDDFMNTKGTSTISDVDLDSAIRLTQSQILSSLRASGHLSGHFVQGHQRSPQGHEI